MKQAQKQISNVDGIKLIDFYTIDPTQRISLSVRGSTLDELELYRAYYVQQYGKTPGMPALIEQVLRQFFAEDTGFQRVKPSLSKLADEGSVNEA